LAVVDLNKKLIFFKLDEKKCIFAKYWHTMMPL